MGGHMSAAACMHTLGCPEAEVLWNEPGMNMDIWIHGLMGECIDGLIVLQMRLCARMVLHIWGN